MDGSTFKGGGIIYPVKIGELPTVMLAFSDARVEMTASEARKLHDGLGKLVNECYLASMSRDRPSNPDLQQDDQPSNPWTSGIF